MMISLDLRKNFGLQQAWLQPYKAPCIVESGSYAITTVKSPYDFLTFFQNFERKSLTDRHTKQKSDMESSKPLKQFMFADIG